MKTMKVYLPVGLWAVFDWALVVARDFVGGPAMSFPPFVCNVECHAKCFFMGLSVRLYTHAKHIKLSIKIK